MGKTACTSRPTMLEWRERKLYGDMNTSSHAMNELMTKNKKERVRYGQQQAQLEAERKLFLNQSSRNMKEVFCHYKKVLGGASSYPLLAGSSHQATVPLSTVYRPSSTAPMSIMHPARSCGIDALSPARSGSSIKHSPQIGVGTGHSDTGRYPLHSTVSGSFVKRHSSMGGFSYKKEHNLLPERSVSVCTGRKSSSNGSSSLPKQSDKLSIYHQHVLPQSLRNRQIIPGCNTIFNSAMPADSANSQDTSMCRPTDDPLDFAIDIVQNINLPEGAGDVMSVYKPTISSRAKTAEAIKYVSQQSKHLRSGPVSNKKQRFSQKYPSHAATPKQRLLGQTDSRLPNIKSVEDEYLRLTHSNHMGDHLYKMSSPGYLTHLSPRPLASVCSHTMFLRVRSGTPVTPHSSAEVSRNQSPECEEAPLPIMRYSKGDHSKPVYSPHSMRPTHVVY